MPDRRPAVRETYDRIASHFAATREVPWPEVETFLAEATGSVGLDVGCANGRHSELLADRTDLAIGLDLSRTLLDIGVQRAHDRGYDAAFVQADATAIPVRTNAVDVGVYVATLHHLPTRADRLASLDELARVLAPGGRALLSVWSTDHDRFEATTAFDTTIGWTLPTGETVDRFYHIYSPESFAADLDASDLVVLETELSSGNCYATVSAPETGRG